MTLDEVHERSELPKLGSPRAEYSLLPFNFIRLDDRREVLTNLVGEYIVGKVGVARSIAERRVPRESALYQELKAKHFVFDAGSSPLLSLLATKFRTKKAPIFDGPRLHMLVLTLRCEHSCQYCQVSREIGTGAQFDMSIDTARRAIDLMLESPAQSLTLEFQGGEPFLNFSVLRQATEYAQSRAASTRRSLRIVVATNLVLATDDMLHFCRDRGVLLSTSLDGPRDLHNANRPRAGINSYDLAIAAIERARKIVGPHSVSALMTTTRSSLGRAREIVDEYIRQGFESIFLRSLSPYGFAAKRLGALGYAMRDFIEFYKDGLAYVLELNARGVAIEEVFAKIALTKILTPFSTGYVDLQSPAGAGTSCVAYNYDGRVYASDEGRMLAAVGDHEFCLGTLGENSYQEIFAGPVMRGLEAAMCAEALPGCSQCAFLPYCGADPVFHYGTQGDAVGHRPSSAFCERNMAIFRHLIALIEDGGPEVERLFLRWTRSAAAEAA